MQGSNNLFCETPVHSNILLVLLADNRFQFQKLIRNEYAYQMIYGQRPQWVLTHQVDIVF